MAKATRSHRRGTNTATATARLGFWGTRRRARWIRSSHQGAIEAMGRVRVRTKRTNETVLYGDEVRIAAAQVRTGTVRNTRGPQA